MSGKFQEMLEAFRNDEHWNTPVPGGGHRFDKELEWLETTVKAYAKKLGLSEDRVAELMEEKRTFSWPNYYQPSNFPDLDGANVVGVFETAEAFYKHAEEHWKGFKCPKCGAVSQDPQNCAHRLEKDGACDWCAYGLFKSGTCVIILESGLSAIPIFEPVKKEGPMNQEHAPKNEPAPESRNPLRWINAQGNPPELGVKVLALDRWGTIMDRELREYSAGVLLFDPDGQEIGSSITHWMPMPGPEYWIDAKERLPVAGVQVLTRDKWGHVKNRALRKYALDDPLLFRPDGLKPSVDILRWMPLPELPQKEK